MNNMKKVLLFLILLMLSIASQATVYYISSTGNDANDGLSTETPKQTLTAVNGLSPSAGDQVLFERGGTWIGTLTPNESGSSGNPIIYGAYGTGANPIITGFVSVSAWTNLGGNIWESTNAVSTLTKCNMVTIAGASVRMGREPDSGFYYYQSHTNSPSTITSSDLTGTPNWTGAEIALVLYPWTIGRDPITAQTGSTLTYTKSGSDVNPYQDNQRFIIQNDVRTLDTQNEWYYNPTTKKLSVYSTTEPANVKVATVDKLVDLVGYDYITFQNITFEGANMSAFNVDNTDNLTVSNCTIKQNGFDAFYGLNTGTSPSIIIEDCVISDNNHAAIGLNSAFTSAIVRRNTITNSGVVFGSGRYTYPVTVLNGVAHYVGVALAGEGSLIENNSIINSGYHATAFYKNNSIVQNNFIKGFCQTTSDGGGVYTWGTLTPTVYSGMKVLNNIIENDNYTDNGIYMDDLSNHVEITGNTVSKCANGIYYHNIKFVTARENTLFDNTYSFLASNAKYATYPFEGNIFNSNILIAKSSSQYCIKGDYMERVIAGLSNDSNIIAKPINDNIIATFFNREPFSAANLTLSQWKTYCSDDAHSTGSPYSIQSANELCLIYNSDTIAKAITTPFPIKELNGTQHYSSATLQPSESLIGFYDSTIPTPTTKKYFPAPGSKYYTIRGVRVAPPSN